MTLAKHYPRAHLYNVQYEVLVQDNENESTRLIDSCAFEWEDGCVDFHKTRRSVRTASVTQVRPLLDTSSVEGGAMNITLCLCLKPLMTRPGTLRIVFSMTCVSLSAAKAPPGAIVTHGAR
ncbi:MAG: hypothetical protein ACI9DC_005138 [Gammaproteobacteria bacterium]|jgi:hypothetical protein